MSDAERDMDHDFRQSLLEDLKSLVRIPSVTAAPAEGSPFGEAVERALEKALALAGERGFITENHDGWYGTAFLRPYRPGEPLIGIFSHLDVVEPGEGWIYKPFEPVEENDFLIGRGAGDNKSGAVIGLYAMQRIKEEEIPLQSNVMLYFGTNEESGMKDVERFLQDGPVPDYSMVPDLFFPVCYGEKGSLKLWLCAKRPFRQVIAFQNGKADNIIPDCAQAELRLSPGLVKELEAKAGKDESVQWTQDQDTVMVSAHGTGGHSAMPKGKTNAIVLLAGFLSGLESLDSQDRGVLETLAFWGGDVEGTNLEIDCSDEPSGALVSTPVRTELENGALKVMFSTRYPVTGSSSCILEALLPALEAGQYLLTEYDDHPPMYRDPDSPFIRTLMGAYRDVVGKDKKPFVIDGGTYARKLPHAVGFGGGNGIRADFLPEGHGAVHQPDEARSIPGILEAVEVYVRALQDVDRLISQEHILSCEGESL